MPPKQQPGAVARPHRGQSLSEPLAVCALESCGKELLENDSKISCGCCKKLFHQTCSGAISAVIKEALTPGKRVRWFCVACDEVVDDLFGGLTNIGVTSKELDRRVTKIESCDLDTRVTALETSGASSDTEATVKKVVAEVFDINKRKRNVLMFGVPECTEQPIPDGWLTEKVSSAITYLGIGATEYNLVTCFRIGAPPSDDSTKCRPIKIVLGDESQRNLVISRSNNKSSSKNTNNDNSTHKNYYFRYDLTKMQQKENNALREQMRTRAAKGERVKIKRGAVVRRTSTTASELPLGQGDAGITQ